MDNNKEKWGKQCLGKEIHAPEKLKELPEALVIITSISYLAIKESMERRQLNNDVLIVPYYFSHYTESVSYDNNLVRQHMIANKTEITDLYNRSDCITETYLNMICEMREKGEDDLYTEEFYAGTGVSQAYFCDKELAPPGDVTYVDVGAYNGDSIEPVYNFYKDRLKCCYAFEPNEEEAACLSSYLQERGLQSISTIFTAALSDKNEDARLVSNGLQSCITSNGDSSISMRRFDDLENIRLIGDMMIKMDIEGAEMSALKGMAETIREYKPYMAICIYHKYTDLLDVPRFLKSLYPGYRFYIRGGWHLECWAIPERHFYKNC